MAFEDVVSRLFSLPTKGAAAKPEKKANGFDEKASKVPNGEDKSPTDGQNADPQQNGQQVDPQPDGQIAEPQSNGQQAESQPAGQNADPQQNGQQVDPQPDGQIADPQPNGQDAEPQPKGQNAEPLPTGQHAKSQPDGQNADPQPDADMKDGATAREPVPKDDLNTALKALLSDDTEMNDAAVGNSAEMHTGDVAPMDTDEKVEGTGAAGRTEGGPAQDTTGDDKSAPGESKPESEQAPDAAASGTGEPSADLTASEEETAAAAGSGAQREAAASGAAPQAAPNTSGTQRAPQAAPNTSGTQREAAASGAAPQAAPSTPSASLETSAPSPAQPAATAKVIRKPPGPSAPGIDGSPDSQPKAAPTPPAAAADGGAVSPEAASQACNPFVLPTTPEEEKSGGPPAGFFDQADPDFLCNDVPFFNQPHAACGVPSAQQVADSAFFAGVLSEIGGDNTFDSDADVVPPSVCVDDAPLLSIEAVDVDRGGSPAPVDDSLLLQGGCEVGGEDDDVHDTFCSQSLLDPPAGARFTFGAAPSGPERRHAALAQALPSAAAAATTAVVKKWTGRSKAKDAGHPPAPPAAAAAAPAPEAPNRGKWLGVDRGVLPPPAPAAAAAAEPQPSPPPPRTGPIPSKSDRTQHVTPPLASPDLLSEADRPVKRPAPVPPPAARAPATKSVAVEAALDEAAPAAKKRKLVSRGTSVDSPVLSAASPADAVDSAAKKVSILQIEDALRWCASSGRPNLVLLRAIQSKELRQDIASAVRTSRVFRTAYLAFLITDSCDTLGDRPMDIPKWIREALAFNVPPENVRALDALDPRCFRCRLQWCRNIMRHFEIVLRGTPANNPFLPPPPYLRIDYPTRRGEHVEGCRHAQ
ncbi:Circumsporozoite protein [Diplonema papillatum]|nr:Circumsporozoite protein [Diplonema papillatum]